MWKFEDEKIVVNEITSMKSKLSIILSLLLILNSCAGPQQSKGEGATVENTAPINTKNEFADKGKIVNGVKVGKWVEYTVDTIKAQPLTVIEGNTKRQVELNETILNVKGEGNYENGLRHGKWIFYNEFTNSRPILWVKTSEINYNKGKKHGIEINFSISGDTSMVKSYLIDQEEGIRKIFNLNFPFKIWKIYYTINGEGFPLKEFYPSGNLKFAIKNIENEVNLKLYQGFFESGKIMIEGNLTNNELRQGKWKTYYENGGLESEIEYQNDQMNGYYKLYHENGQLWSEKTYREGKPWEVISNYDSKGNRKDQGTLKNGTGSIKLYNDYGELDAVENYFQGIEK
jgi:antitoxin component YwqK of YwqJK toxin-antitoxin module